MTILYWSKLYIFELRNYSMNYVLEISCDIYISYLVNETLQKGEFEKYELIHYQ